MRLKKIRNFFRFIFPKKFSEVEIFENSLRSNNLIKKFVRSDSIYELELIDGSKIITRDQSFSDYEVFKQIFNNREYDIPLKIMNMNLNLQREKIIIDAGANVGYSSIFFSSNLGDVKIYGIEPSNANLEIYKKNIKYLKAPEKVKTYHKALSEKNNVTFALKRNFRDKGDWAITTEEDFNGEIKSITIEEIIRKNKLDYVSLLKIDIEGAERFIFKKGNNFSFLKKTQIIAIEIHPEFQVKEEIYDILRDHEFLLFETGETTIGINKNIFI